MRTSSSPAGSTAHTPPIHPYVRIFLFLALCCVVGCSSLSSPSSGADQPKPGPEHKRMAAYVGTWFGELPAVPTPFEPDPATLTTEVSYRMILGGFFLEGKGLNTYQSDGKVHHVEERYIMGYDPVKKTYIRYQFVDFGPSDSWPVTVNGNTWTSIDKSTHEGKVFTVRATETFSPDGQSLTLAAEYRSDSDSTWKPWFKGTLKRTTTPGTAPRIP